MKGTRLIAAHAAALMSATGATQEPPTATTFGSPAGGAFLFHLALGAAFCRRVQAGFCHEVFLRNDSGMPTGCAGGLAGPDVCRPVNVARRAASVSVTFF